MPSVTLAYAWEGNEPDKTIDVDDATAVDLLNRGWARPADQSSRKGGK